MKLNLPATKPAMTARKPNDKQLRNKSGGGSTDQRMKNVKKPMTAKTVKKQRSTSKESVRSNGTTKMSFSRDYTVENDDELAVSPNRNETHRLPVMANMKTKTIGAIKTKPKQS